MNSYKKIKIRVAAVLIFTLILSVDTSLVDRGFFAKKPDGVAAGASIAISTDSNSFAVTAGVADVMIGAGSASVENSERGLSADWQEIGF